MAAQDAYEQRKLDRLILVPAAQAPLKPNDVQSSTEARLAMLRAAMACGPSRYMVGRGTGGLRFLMSNFGVVA